MSDQQFGRCISHLGEESENDLIFWNDIQILKPYLPLFVRYHINSLIDLFGPQLGTLLSRKGVRFWRERLRLEFRDEENRSQIFYLKRFQNPPRFLHRDVGSIDGASSVAEVEWKWLWKLRELGIPAPIPIAFGHEVKGKREIRSAVITKAVPGNSLEYWMQQWTIEDQRTIRALLGPVADLVSRLHACGIIHRDLYLTHIFFDPYSPLETALHFIDLQRAFQPKWFWRRWIVKELAALNYSTPLPLVSMQDRIRWFKKYRGISGLGRSEKRLIGRIIRKTRVMARHDAKRRG